MSFSVTFSYSPLSAMEEFKVVVNEEQQYSIWPTWKPDPPGWNDEGVRGTKQVCLEHIEKVWTDMRPLSLRKWMEENKLPVNEGVKLALPVVSDTSKDYFHAAKPPNELVKKLMKEQTVQIIRYLENSKPSIEKLRRAVEVGYILVKFSETKGGTELGCNVKNENPRCSVEWKDSKIIFHGRLKLDFTPILVHATIDLTTFQGTGYVEPIEDWKKQ